MHEFATSPSSRVSLPEPLGCVTLLSKARSCGSSPSVTTDLYLFIDQFLLQPKPSYDSQVRGRIEHMKCSPMHEWWLWKLSR